MTASATRPPTATAGPYSTGAVETVNLSLASELIGARANRLGNGKRLIKLFDLLTVGLNGHANERAFAKAIRLPLEGHDGRPLLYQRPHDDDKGQPSRVLLGEAEHAGRRAQHSVRRTGRELPRAAATER